MDNKNEKQAKQVANCIHMSRVVGVRNWFVLDHSKLESVRVWEMEVRVNLI